MTRADALFEAAWRWEQRYHDEWVELDGTWPHRLSPRLAGNPMSRRLWCLKHAKRCRTLGLRAMREEARQERLARYRADNPSHVVWCDCDCDQAHRALGPKVIHLRPEGA